MSLVTHIVFLFIFVLSMLMINMPQIAENDFIRMKLYLFVGIFLFEVLVVIFKNMYDRKIINIKNICRQALQTALLSVIAYSVYTDLTLIDFNLPDQNNTYIKNLTITSIIIFFVLISYFFDTVLSDIAPGINDELNILYKDQ